MIPFVSFAFLNELSTSLQGCVVQSCPSLYPQLSTGTRLNKLLVMDDCLFVFLSGALFFHITCSTSIEEMATTTFTLDCFEFSLL